MRSLGHCGASAIYWHLAYAFSVVRWCKVKRPGGKMGVLGSPMDMGQTLNGKDEPSEQLGAVYFLW